MSKESQIIFKTNNNTPSIELWSSNENASISVGYDSANSLFSISTGNAFSNNLISFTNSETSLNNILDLNNNKISNIPVPSSDNDIATKNYALNNFGTIPTAGSGLSLSSNNYSVNSSQTQITSIGNLTTGSILSSFGNIFTKNNFQTTEDLFVGNNVLTNFNTNFKTKVENSDFSGENLQSVFTTSYYLTKNNAIRGQIKIITFDGSSNGSYVTKVTVPNGIGFQYIDFTRNAQSVILVYNGTGWAIVSNSGATIS